MKELSPAVRRAQDLIRIPSISETEPQNTVQLYIAQDLERHGISTELSTDGNVYASIEGRNPKKNYYFFVIQT